MRYTSIIKYTIHNKTILKRFINQYFETFYNLNLLDAYHRKTSERIEISYLFEQCLQYIAVQTRSISHSETVKELLPS